jgi:hypothetical protein
MLSLLVLPTLVLKSVSKIKEDKQVRIKNIFCDVFKNCHKLLAIFLMIFILVFLSGALKENVVNIPMLFAFIDMVDIIITYVAYLIAIIALCRFYEKVMVVNKKAIIKKK